MGTGRSLAAIAAAGLMACGTVLVGCGSSEAAQPDTAPQRYYAEYDCSDRFLDGKAVPCEYARLPGAAYESAYQECPRDFDPKAPPRVQSGAPGDGIYCAKDIGARQAPPNYPDVEDVINVAAGNMAFKEACDKIEAGEGAASQGAVLRARAKDITAAARRSPEVPMRDEAGDSLTVAEFAARLYEFTCPAGKAALNAAGYKQ